jgi:hypothetical protein
MTHDGSWVTWGEHLGVGCIGKGFEVVMAYVKLFYLFIFVF